MMRKTNVRQNIRPAQRGLVRPLCDFVPAAKFAPADARLVLDEQSKPGDPPLQFSDVAYLVSKAYVRKHIAKYGHAYVHFGGTMQYALVDAQSAATLLGESTSCT